MNADLAVVGAGPAGLTAAILAARRGLSVVLLGDGPAHPGRIELAPPTLVPLLLDLGVHPIRAGWSGACARRRVAWETAAPVLVEERAAALIERPRLEQSLDEMAARETRIHRVPRQSAPPRSRGIWCGDAWQSPLLLDATGRRALLARDRVRWTSVAWHWTGPPSGDADRPASFAIAALPDGYAYRLQTRVGDQFARVTLRPGRVGLVDTLGVLDAHGLRWLTEGFDAGSAVAARPVAAGLQRSRLPADGTLLAIGDTALARDPLSSQGVLSAMVDACHAIDSLKDTRAWASLTRDRAEGEWQRHLTHLKALVERGRFAGEGAWRQYGEWLRAFGGDVELEVGGSSGTSGVVVAPFGKAKRQGARG